MQHAAEDVRTCWATSTSLDVEVPIARRRELRLPTVNSRKMSDHADTEQFAI